MPDPILYLKAFIAVVIAGATVLLVLRLVVRDSTDGVAAAAGVVAISVGLMAGYDVLLFSWTWSPANGLNRFLMIVLPVTLIVELLTAVFDGGIHARFVPTGLRVILYAGTGRILLHDSVYLSGVSSESGDAWTITRTVATLGTGFGGLMAVWSLLSHLSRRSASCGITLSLAIAVLCTGLATMMAGYIKGGVAAIPLAAALLGVALVSPFLTTGPGDKARPYLQGAIGIGVIGLFSLLCIGHYFGQLSGPRAMVIFLAPLLCWTSEFPSLRSKSRFQKSVVCLIVVTIPLATVLYVAKREFNRKMAPLLAGVPCVAASISVSPALASSPSFSSSSQFHKHD